MSLRTAHVDGAWVVIIANALAGLWALGAHWLAPLRRRELWWLVIVAQASIFVQVILGVWMLSVDGVEAPRFHTFYGFATLFFVAIFYAYRNTLRAQLYLLYGFGGLFLMGMGIRAVVLG